MAINKNFVVKNGLEVNTDQIFADSSSGKVGIGSTLPTVELDVQGAIAATDVTSSLLRVTGYSTLPQTTVNDNLTVLGFTTVTNDLNALGISSLSNLRVVGVTTVSSLGSPSEILVVGTGKSLASLSNITADASGINISGVVTATSFSGSFSGGINIGIQSGGSTVSTATSIINFDISNGTLTAAASDGGAGITTVTITPTGVSIGLAIALGG